MLHAKENTSRNLHSSCFFNTKNSSQRPLLGRSLEQTADIKTTTSIETPVIGRCPAPLRVSARWSDAPEEGHASSPTLTPSFSVLEDRHKGIRALCVVVSGHAVGDPAGHEVTQRHHNRHSEIIARRS